MLQVHHLDPDNYEDLTPSKFKLLCSTCHDAVELLYRRLQSKKGTILNRDKWINLYGDFLPNQPIKTIDTNCV